MDNIIIRSEELSDEQIIQYYVKNEQDQSILRTLKSQSPVLLVGSRGMGKSFLFKISQLELQRNFEKDRIFPIFLTFRSVSLVQTGNKAQFEQWMLNRICTSIIRELRKKDLSMIINGILEIYQAKMKNMVIQYKHLKRLTSSLKIHGNIPGLV